jgi:hypothetical protein
MVYIHELSTNKTSSEYYSESAKIFVYHDIKYYDEIVTTPQVQARELYDVLRSTGRNRKYNKRKNKENCIIRRQGRRE